MKKFKQIGLSSVLLLTVLLIVSFLAVLAKQFMLEKADNVKHDTFDLMVQIEANNLENLTKQVDAWFALKGRSELFFCETGPTGDPDCQTDIPINIWPSQSDVSVHQFPTIASAANGYEARVVKTAIIGRGGEHKYKIVIYPK